MSEEALAALRRIQHIHNPIPDSIFANDLATIRAALEESGRDAERLTAALELVWTIQVRKEVHLGRERWSGFEQGCIACICALATGASADESPTAEEFKARRAKIKEGDAARAAEGG